MSARVGIRTNARECIPNTNDAEHRKGSRGVQASAAPDEDNASLLWVTSRARQ